MKIEYIRGDLFTTDIEVIVHGCNAQGVMGSGVAKIIREKYPKAYERYRKDFEFNKGLKLGEIIAVPCGDRVNDRANYKVIVNAITQEFYGRDGQRYVSYDAVADAMERIDRMSQIYGITEVAMPKIGAGYGGGDWNVIESIIESELKQVRVVVYEL